MLEFLLNDRLVRTEYPSGAVLLDFIRYTQHLTGTKIGCREGDCGACTVLLGEWTGHCMHYRSATSCLTPLANVAGKHVVTIEGLNMPALNPAQHAFVEEGATQCGFCTPGFIVSLTGYGMQAEPSDHSGAVAAMDGNICRCTGYKSIERAAQRFAEALAQKDAYDPVSWLVAKGFLPAYFSAIPERIKTLQTAAAGTGEGICAGGGTDLYVQKHDALAETTVTPLRQRPGLRGIAVENNTCTVGAATTVSEFMEDPRIQAAFPRLREHLKLVSSTPIRNLATLGGNFANASPIGDMTIFFLALDARITLEEGEQTRTILLKDLYKGYKTLDMAQGAVITALSFDLPEGRTHFNFEKVSKRTHLDIASVNSAIRLEMADAHTIGRAALSAGGVAPVPLFLACTSAWLAGKSLRPEVLREAQGLLQDEVAPISDVRGSAAYKRLLLRQLFYAHFITLFPDRITLKDVLP